MLEAMLTSVGVAGEPDFNRSEGRAYQTIPHVVTDVSELRDSFSYLKEQSMLRGRRRYVLRAECSLPVKRDLTLDMVNKGDLPVEVILDTSIVDPSKHSAIVYIGENVHTGTTETRIDDLDKFWRLRPELGNLAITPEETIDRLGLGFELTTSLNQMDAGHLYDLWKKFGWSESGVLNFIRQYRNPESTLWFSGIREKCTGNVVAACMGEPIRFGETLMVEGTEYATAQGFEGKGLCTAAVIGLHAQVFKDTLYKTGEVPMIISEFNIASRSDVVGYKAGMHVVTADRDGISPPQILHKNVSIYDDQKVNDVNWRSLGEERNHYRDAFRHPYRYWRDFVVGVLPFTNIVSYYRKDATSNILAHYYEE